MQTSQYHAEKRAYARRWYYANREYALAQARVRAAKWRMDNPARVRATSITWRKEHPDRVQANTRRMHARRRARIASVLTTLTTTEWEAILEAADHACIYCGSQEQPTMDHLTPLARGGNHTAENVAPACRPCNSSKGARTVQEWMAEAS